VLSGVTVKGTAGTGAAYGFAVGRGARAVFLGGCNDANLRIGAGITGGGSVGVCDGCILGSGVGALGSAVGGVCVGMVGDGVLVGSMVGMVSGQPLCCWKIWAS
jgi:hypothetical protein